MVLTIGSEAEWAGAYPLSLPEAEYQLPHYAAVDISVAKKAKRLGGKRHVLIQATLSTKLNNDGGGRSGVVQEPVEDLVSDFATRRSAEARNIN